MLVGENREGGLVGGDESGDDLIERRFGVVVQNDSRSGSGSGPGSGASDWLGARFEVLRLFGAGAGAGAGAESSTGLRWIRGDLKGLDNVEEESFNLRRFITKDR